MPNLRRFSLAEMLGYLGLALMCLVWTGYGWLILSQGYFMSRPRRSTITTTVSGLPSIFMAFVLIALGAIAICIILNRFNVARHRVYLASAAVIGTPLLFVVTR